MTIGRKVRVVGRVQGVFFRQWTVNQARTLGVSGWVRNCPDGSVEAHVEGDDGAVERMVGLLRQGPPHARVDDIEVREADSEGGDRFEIRH